MAKLTQAQKDAYIAELESKLEDADSILNDQLNIPEFNSCSKKKKHKKIEQKKRSTMVNNSVTSSTIIISYECIYHEYLCGFV